jgi:hypothetical protein
MDSGKWQQMYQWLNFLFSVENISLQEKIETTV